MHANEVHPHEMHAREMHAHEVHAYEVHAHKVHAREVHAREMIVSGLHRHRRYRRFLPTRVWPVRVGRHPASAWLILTHHCHFKQSASQPTKAAPRTTIMGNDAKAAHY